MRKLILLVLGFIMLLPYAFATYLFVFFTAFAAPTWSADAKVAGLVFTGIGLIVYTLVGAYMVYTGPVQDFFNTHIENGRLAETERRTS